MPFSKNSNHLAAAQLPPNHTIATAFAMINCRSLRHSQPIVILIS